MIGNVSICEQKAFFICLFLFLGILPDSSVLWAIFVRLDGLLENREGNDFNRDRQLNKKHAIVFNAIVVNN